MRNLINSIVADVAGGKLKLKEAKENFSIFLGGLDNPAGYVLVAGEEVQKARTAVAFSDALERFVGQAEQAEREALPAVTELDALKVEIKETLNRAGKSSYELGNLLIKAREACDNQAAFLAWVDENFGIKKAWAFRLMKVSSVFKDEVWQGVSPNVLYALHNQADESQTEQAKELAALGDLNSKTLSLLLTPPASPVKPAGQANVQTTEETLTGAGEEVSAATGFDTGTDVQIDLGRAKLTDTPENITAPWAADAPESGLIAKLQELTALLSAQQARNEALQLELLELKVPKLRTSNLPMLPQFTSKSMYARLGLDASECPSQPEILEAFKALCKAGYGRGHEAFELLDEARHNLFHAVK